MLIMRYMQGTGDAPWILTLGGVGQSDTTRGHAIDLAGNSLVGFVANNTSGSEYNGMVKVNKYGNVLWQRTLTGTTASSPRDVFVDYNTGSYYVCGQDEIAGLDKMIVVKYNSAGLIEWQKTLGHATSQLLGRAVVTDDSGNVYCTSRIFPNPDNPSDTNDIVVVKYNSQGILQWHTSYSGVGQDWGYQMVRVPTGGLYIVGNATVGSPATGHLAVIKLDDNGDTVWQRGIINGTAREVVVDGNGDVIVTGVVGTNIATMKYNSSGVLQWHRELDAAPSGEMAIGCCVDSSNDIYVVGRTQSPFIVVVLKYNSSGVLQWQRTIDGVGGQDEGWKILHTNGWLYVTGSTRAPSDGTYDAVLIAKLKDDGTGTGTFGNGEFTYAASSFTELAGSGVDYPISLTDRTDTLVDGTGAMVEATSNFVPVLHTAD
jgi:hypothetical protein